MASLSPTAAAPQRPSDVGFVEFALTKEMFEVDELHLLDFAARFIALAEVNGKSVSDEDVEHHWRSEVQKVHDFGSSSANPCLTR